MTKVPRTVDVPFKGLLNGRVTLQSFEVSSCQFAHFENISQALIRVDRGTYGKCMLCDGQIEAEVLTVTPWATECLECWDQDQP